MERVERIVRQKIHDSLYFKTACFGINAADFCDRAAACTAVGGLVHARPTDFLCLVYKLVLIAPSSDIVVEMLRQPYFKYLTAAAAVYIRLLYNPLLVHQLLEPLYADYRKLRCVGRDGAQRLLCVDELVDALLTQERFFDLLLPTMPARAKLERVGLGPRANLLVDSRVGSGATSGAGTARVAESATGAAGGAVGRAAPRAATPPP